MCENKKLGVNVRIMEDALYEILNGEWSVEDTALESCRVRTFEQSGLMTYNKGLVITLSDRTEYQLTIVKSR